MKIISKGTTTAHCTRCGCDMEYDSKDIYEKLIEVGTSTWFKSLTKYVTSEYIVCPLCGREIAIGRKPL